MNHEDIRILSEIKCFLDENNVDYSEEYNNFCLNFGNPNNKRSYEIEYVSSYQYQIEHKKFNIAGVQKDHFFNKSYQAEHEHNSFKCWVKDYEWNDDRKREVLKSYFLHEF